MTAYDESLRLYIPVKMDQMLSPAERIQFQNFVHTAAVNSASQWLDENFPPSGNRTVDLSGLISHQEARECFESDSRAQVIVDEIYKGGTRAEIVRRINELRLFANEQNFVPGYVSHIMNRLRRNES